MAADLLVARAEPPSMTPDEFRKAIKARGMFLRDAARFLGVNERSVRSWVAGDNRIPMMAVKLILTLPTTEESIAAFGARMEAAQ